MEQETQLRTMKEGGEEEQNKTAEDIKTESMKTDTTGEDSDTVTGELDSVDKDIHTNSYGPECTKTSTADEDITVSLDRDSKVLETLLLDKKEKPVETESNLEKVIEEKEIELVKILVNKEREPITVKENELEASVMGIQLEELQNKQKNEVQGTETTEIKQAKETVNIEIKASMVMEKKAIEPVKETKALEKIENKQKCSVKRTENKDTESAKQTEKKEMEYAKVLEKKELGPSNVTEVTKISGNGEIEPMGMIENEEFEQTNVAEKKEENEEFEQTNVAEKKEENEEFEQMNVAEKKEEHKFEQMNVAEKKEKNEEFEQTNVAEKKEKNEEFEQTNVAEKKEIKSVTEPVKITGNKEIQLGKVEENKELQPTKVREKKDPGQAETKEQNPEYKNLRLAENSTAEPMEIIENKEMQPTKVREKKDLGQAETKEQNPEYKKLRLAENSTAEPMEIIENKEMQPTKVREKKDLGQAEIKEQNPEYKKLRLAENSTAEPMEIIENKEMQPAEVTEYKVNKKVESGEALENKWLKSMKETDSMEKESERKENENIEPVKVTGCEEILAGQVKENKKLSQNKENAAKQSENKEMEQVKVTMKMEIDQAKVTENEEIEPRKMTENEVDAAEETNSNEIEPRRIIEDDGNNGAIEQVKSENVGVSECAEDKKIESMKILEEKETFSPGIKGNDEVELRKHTEEGERESTETLKNRQESIYDSAEEDDLSDRGKHYKESETEIKVSSRLTKRAIESDDEEVTPVHKKFKLSVCDETVESQEISKERNHCRDSGDKNCRVRAEIFVNRSDISTEDCTDEKTVLLSDEENSVIEIEDEEKPETEDDTQSEDKDEKEMTQSQDEGASSQDTYCSEKELNRKFCEEPVPESSNETLEGTTSFGDVSQATTADVELETTHTEDDMFATQVDTAGSSGTDYEDFKGSKLMQSSSTMSESLSARKRKLSDSDTLGTAPKLQCIEEERSLSKYTTEDIEDDEELTVIDATSRKLVFEPDVDKPKFVLVANKETEVSQRKSRKSIEVLYMKSKSDTAVDVVDLVEDSQLDSSEDLCLRLSPSPTPRTQELSSYSSCKSSNRSSETTSHSEQNDKWKRDGTTVSLDNVTPSSGPHQQKQQQLSEDALIPVTDMSSIESDATQKLMGCEQRKMLMEVTVELKYTLHDNKVMQRRVLQCDDVTDEFLNAMTRKLSDCSSSGGLADSSSKNTSPSSSSSGPGLFALQPARKSLMSLLSGSSSSSGGSSVAQHAVLGVKQMSGQFVVPNPPKKPTPDKSVEGVEHIIQTLSNIEREMDRSPKITETPKSRMMPFKTSTVKKKYRFIKKNESKTEETAAEDKTPAVSGEATLKPGQQVFARWTDRKYYSGKVKEIGKDGRLLVNFDDGNSKSLVADFVIPVKELDKGQSVYALADEEEYLSGVIVKVEKKRGDTVYSVELDEGQNVSVSRSSIFMTEDQAKTLKEVIAAASPMKTTPQRITDVSLDNVLEGKRSRTRSKDVQKLLESPGVSGVGKRKVSSPVSSESDLGSAVDCVDGVELETPGREIKSGRVKGLRKGTATKNELSDEFGPVPETGSRIFTGKCFLLTHSDAKLERSVSEVSDVDMTDYEEPMFSKSYLTKQIQAGGGDVYARFEDVPPSKYKSCYLVANKPCQTALYILCLAHSIDIVTSTWIIVSCKENVCVPTSSYILPAGYSLEKKEFVSRSKKQPLQKIKVGLVSDVKFFIKFWKKVLEAAGASVCAIPPQRTMKEMKDLQVLVSNHCPFEVYKQIEELGKPLVTTKWVVQCLVNGSRLSYTGHCDYSYNQAQSDE